MKLARRLLMLMLVMLVAFAVTACGDDDDKKDSKDSKTGVKKSASFSDPKELVEYYVANEVQLQDDMDTIEGQCRLFSNETALKKLDLYDEDDVKSPKYTWKITKSKEYKEGDDVTDGMKNYILRRGGDEEQVQGVSIVEVAVTAEKDDEKEKQKYYFTAVKVGGKWYVIDESSADNINEIADKWSEMR